MPRWLLAILLAALVGVRLLADPLIAELLAVIAASLAAASFTVGDPPRRPWTLRALALALVLVAHSLMRLSPAAPQLGLALLVLANLLGAAAIVGFIQLVRRSGLTAPLTTLGAAVLGGLAIAAAGALALVLVQVAPQADAKAVVIAVSTACDAVVFVGAALLLRLVLPLRGGLVAQPYALLVLDGLCYLVADLGLAVTSPALVAAIPYVSAIGGAAGASAGLAQAALLRPPRRGLARSPHP